MGVVNGMRLILSGKVNDVTYKGATLLDDNNIALLDTFTTLVDNLTNYYTKEEIDSIISVNVKIEIVDELPTDDIRTDTIYFLRKDTVGLDIYDEYIYLESKGGWEYIGSTEIDLSSYATKEYVDSNFVSVIQNPKTPEMNSRVGIDENGQLWYEKGSGGSVSGKEVDYAGTIDYYGTITSSLYPELNGTRILDINNAQYKNLVFKATDNYNGRNKTLKWDQEHQVGDFGSPEFTDYNTYLNYFYTVKGVYCKNYEFDGENLAPIDVVEFENILTNESVYFVIPNETVIKINFNGLDHINKSIEPTSTLAMSELLFEDLISVFTGDYILINNDENPFIKITSADGIVTEIFDNQTGITLTGRIDAQQLSQILDVGSSIMIDVEGGF